jgi:3,4-dihydroxy 2-butanone 4-phosphate synthase/GTP cyclohydrolase II
MVSVESALEQIGDGRMVVVVGDPEASGAGTLVMAAQLATPDAIELMTGAGDGGLCVALPPGRCEELRLGVDRPDSFDAREGAGEGASALVRAVRTAIDPTRGAEDIVTPGRVRSLRARTGGVLEYPGDAEAAVDLARLAGCMPAGVICRAADAEAHGIDRISIADLIAYRRVRERHVERVVVTAMPTRFGRFTAVGYRSLLDDEHHMALVKGELDGASDVLVRIHPECLVGDVFHSRRCQCGEQLNTAMSMIEEEGRGVLLYLSREGRSGGLHDVLGAAEPESPDPAADLRNYDLGAQILLDLGLSSIRVLTNDPRKVVAVEGFGLSVSERLPLAVACP